MNLHQKIVEVRKQVPYLQKDTKGYQYQYVSGSSVLGSIKEKMNELGVILYFNLQDYQIVSGGKETIVHSKVVANWVNAEEPTDKIEVAFACFGQDADISKAFGKALTYAERYFLLKFFNIATDSDDPDAFQKKHSEETPKKNNGRLEVLKEANPMQQEVIELAKKVFKGDERVFKKWLIDYYKVDHVSKLTNAQTSHAIDTFQTTLAKQTV